MRGGLMVCGKRFEVVLALAVVSWAGGGLQAGEIEWQTDIDAAWQQAQEDGVPLLVFATRDQCRYCVLMKRQTYADPRLAQQISGAFVPLVVDARREPDLMQELGVQVYPTTVVISPRAEVVERVRGFVQPGALGRQLADAERRALEGERRDSARRGELNRR